MKALVGFCAAVLPPEAGGPDPARLADSVRQFLDVTPRPTRAFLRLALRGIDAYAQVTEGRRLASLDMESRERVLARCTRTATSALVFDFLKTPPALLAGTEREAAETRRRTAAIAPVAPDAQLDVTPADWWPSSSRADVVVVGSGAGGAFCARTLARAGMDVVVLEEGRRFHVEEFRTRHGAHRFAELWRDAATTVTLGRPPIAMPVGRAVGGTTVANSSTCYRTPASVLQTWRDDHGLSLADPDRIGPYLDEVERTLGVAAASSESLGRNGQIALRGAAALGWKAAPLRRNAAGCVGSGQCPIGCPSNAKAGVHLNALPQACDAGARIVERATVERVLHASGRVKAVLARRADGTRFTIETTTVVVACGATETPLLLRRSGLGRHHQLGRNLAIHPAIGISGLFEEPVDASDGVMQSVGMEEFHESDDILVEATAPPPGLDSVLTSGGGRRLLQFMDNSRHLARLAAMIGDKPRGRVLGRKRAYVVYDLDRADAAKLVKAASIMGRMLFAAGAEKVVLGWHRDPVVSSIDELDAACSRVDHRTLHLGAFHPTGTAAAGSDPQRHPVDERGRLRGAEGVWIADASVLPSCPRVNPQISIMAVASAIADEIVKAACVQGS